VVVKELEQQICRLTAKTYDSIRQPPSPIQRVFGRMSDATSCASITGPCGETIEVYLRIEGDVIKDVSFFTDGCGASQICGAVAVALALGKNIDDAFLVGGDTILAVLADLPEDHHHCAYLAAETLQTAIHNYVALPVHHHHLP
jgi:nitrogen fixation protein NifU and related proteins